MSYKLFFIFSLFFTCRNHHTAVLPTVENKKSIHNSNSNYSWSKLLDSAGWKKNYNFQMFAIRDQLWVFHPDGTWHSSDGKNWLKSSLSNAIGNLAFLDYVYYNDNVYGLGHLIGNIEQHTFQPVIYRTKNFEEWETITNASDLPPRFFYHPFVFKNKIWIIGGEDAKTKYSDVWNSENGINWTKQKENLPFGLRSGSQIVSLNHTLYLLNNDVWSSNDGINWKLVTNEIIKGEEVFGYSALVFDDKIWLIGCNRNGQFSSQVLISSDGKNWETQVAPWKPRGGVAAVVFNHKIYMTGGKYGGTPDHPDFRYDNDVWVLEKSNE